MRGLTGLALALAVGGAAAAEDLCGRLSIPNELGLACAPTTEPGEVEVVPVAGTFAALSRMTIRPLSRDGADTLAWSEPARWLERQMTPDTSRLIEALGGLARDPDSPFSGPDAQAALDGLKQALAGVSGLALAGCATPVPVGPRRWRLRCDYTSDGVGLLVTRELVAEGELRWAVTMRAANEQRLRHFEAIAGSFQPS